MDSISLHMNIENSLNETLKQTQILMKSFNSALEMSSKNMGAIEKEAKSTTVHYDDIEEASEKIQKNTFSWRTALGGVRTTLSYIIPSVAAVFSVAGILEAGKAALDFNTQLKNISFRMGDAGKSTTEMRKALFGMVKDTGVAQEKAMVMVETLRGARIAAKDIRELGTATVRYSEITGASAEQAAKLGTELIRTGGLSIKASKSMMTSMAKIQRSVGMTNAEMDQLGDIVIENTKWLGQMDKSAGFIEDFNKGTIKLAGAFRQVGIEVSEVGQLMDRLLDPGRIEDNALLYAKLGISMQDALSGDLDPSMMTEKLKGLGEELKGMGGPAAAALAQALGMPLKQLRQMADIDTSKLGETGGDLESMYKEQESRGEWVERKMNKAQGAMTEAFSFVIEKIDEGVSKLSGMPFLKKSFWIGIVLLGIGAFALLWKTLRKKFFALATDFGGALTKATSEAISMGQQKASIISSKRQGRTGRPEARRQRVEAGPGFQQMEETANYFDVLADSDLFPAIKNMSKNTADWMRKIALGSKGVSLLGQITQENNQAINDRIGMYSNEQAILTHTLDLTIQRKNEEELVLVERQEQLEKIAKTQVLSAKQQKEAKMVANEINKLIGQEDKLLREKNKIQDRFEKSKRRQIHLLEPQAQKQLFEAIQSKTEENKKLLFSGELRKSELDVQMKALETQRAILKTEINHSAASGATAETMLRQNKQLKEMEDLFSEVSGESNELNMNMANARKEITLSNNEMAQLEEATGMAADKLANIDVSQRSGFLTRMSRAVSSTLNKAGSNFRDAFKKARESSIAIGKNIMAKFNPVNWLKSIREKARGFSEKEGGGVVGAIAGLTKSTGVVGLAMGAIGILMKFLRPILEKMQPIFDKVTAEFDKITDEIAPVLIKLGRSLLPVIMTLVRNLLMPLVKILLPPLIKVLGYVLTAIGFLVITIGKLVTKLGAKGVGGNIETMGKQLTQAADQMFQVSTQLQESNKQEKIKNLLISANTNVLERSKALEEMVQLGEITKLEAQDELKKAIIENVEVLRESIMVQKREMFKEQMKDFMAALKETPAFKNEAKTLEALEGREEAFGIMMEKQEFFLLKNLGVKMEQIFGTSSDATGGFRGWMEKTNRVITNAVLGGEEQTGLMAPQEFIGGGKALSIKKILKNEEILSGLSTTVQEELEDMLQNKWGEVYEDIMSGNFETSNVLGQIEKWLAELMAKEETPLIAPTTTAGAAGAQAAQLYAEGGGVVVGPEAEMSIVDNEKETADNTGRAAEAGEIAAEESKKQNENLGTLITTLQGFTGTFQRWMDSGARTPIR